MNTRMTEVPLTRSEIMKRVKQKDTAAELALRFALHGLGQAVSRRLRSKGQIHAH